MNFYIHISPSNRCPDLDVAEVTQDEQYARMGYQGPHIGPWTEQEAHAKAQELNKRFGREYAQSV